MLFKNLKFVRLYWSFLIAITVAGAYQASAQNNPLYNGYFLNPFIYNPATAATDRLEINAGYRRQWFGIKGSPTISSLTVNTLINETRAGIGFRLTSFSRGFLNSTDASVSYAYGVPLDKNNRLFFGLSGGVLSNMLNFSDISVISDPALSSVSSLVPSASFGMLFKNSNGFNFGVALPKLISTQKLDSKYSFSYFDNIIATASFSKWSPKPQPVKKMKGRVYKKKTTNVPLELFSIYRYSVFGSLIEGTAKYNFTPSIWLSATYRQNQGIIPGLGIVADNFSFSYFYELGVGGDLPLQTHEVLLNLRLGKVKKYRDIKPTPPPSKITTQPNKAVVKKTEPVKKIEPVKKEVVQKDTVHRPRLKIKVDLLDTNAVRAAHEAEERKKLEEHIDEHAEGKHDDKHDAPINPRHDFVKRGTHREELDLATYVIAGAFQSRTNAEHYAKTLKSMGYQADFGHLSVRNLWYVFIAEEADIPEARKERDRLQKNRIFKSVWLLTVQE